VAPWLTRLCLATALVASPLVPARADAPAGAADAASGILKVKGNVEGAEVWVDGTLVGKTPLTTYFAPGTHQLRVVADGYDPLVRRIEVAADRTAEVNATLNPGGGTVEFGGQAGARILIDGVDRGPIPIRLPPLTPGKHTWRAEAPAFEPAEGTIEFVAGKNLLLDVKLTSSAGIFVVQSNPPGARVKLDGADVGVTPLRLTGIPLGKHGVSIEADGRATVTRAVDTTAGVRGEVIATLPTTGASVVVTTGAEDAKVYLNDAPVGEGTTVKLASVERGRVRLRVVRGGAEVARTISVPGSGKLELKVAGNSIAERKPLLQRWGFWAAVGGGAVAAGTTAAIVASAMAPEPPPTGDIVVPLP
jgi:hypothetical protein